MDGVISYLFSFLLARSFVVAWLGVWCWVTAEQNQSSSLWGKSCFEVTLVQELLVRGEKGQKEGDARVDVWQVDRMIHVSCLIQEEGVIVGERQAYMKIWRAVHPKRGKRRRRNIICGGGGGGGKQNRGGGREENGGVRGEELRAEGGDKGGKELRGEGGEGGEGGVGKKNFEEEEEEEKVSVSGEEEGKRAERWKVLVTHLSMTRASNWPRWRWWGGCCWGWWWWWWWGGGGLTPRVQEVKQTWWGNFRNRNLKPHQLFARIRVWWWKYWHKQ